MAGGPVGALRVTLGADTANYEQGMRRAAGVGAQFERGMRSATAVSGSYRAGMQQLGFQINDVASQLAMGTRATTIFAQQSGQFIQAIQMMSGGTSRFAAFMDTGWGIALSSAAVVLAPLIARLFDTRTELQKATDELTENARKAEITRQAHEAFGRTIPGVIQQIRSETEALEAQNHALRNNAQEMLERSRQRQANLQAEHNLSMLALRQAERERAALTAEAERAAPGTPEETQVRGRLEQIQARIRELNQTIADLRNGLALAQREAIEAEIAVQRRRAEALADPIAAINQRYDDMAAAAERAAEGNRQLRAALDQTLASIERQRRAALEAARATTGTLVRPVTGAVMSQFGADRSGVPLNGRRIAGRRHEGVDLRGDRGAPVVAPEGGTATVRNAPGGLGLYVEIRADSGARDLLAHLSAANIQSGQRVEAGQLVGLVGNSGNAAGGPPHLHWQRQVNGRWVDPMRSVGSSGAAQEAQAAAREAAQLAERRQRDEEQFQAQMAGLNTDILNARRRQVQTEDEAAADDIAAIRAEQAERDQQIRAEAAARTRRDQSQAVAANIEAGLLLARSQELAQAKIDARNALRQQRLDEQRIEIAQRDLNDQESVLQARSQLARTAVERRDIELRLLALQHQEELLAIEKQRAQQGLTAAQRAQLDRQEAAANERYALGQQSVIRSTMGPLESFMSGLPQTAEQVREALQSIAVDGLQAISDGLVAVITGARKMGDVFRNVVTSIISDLLRIQLQRAIIGPLANALGGIFGGANIGGDAATLAWANPFGGARAAGGPVLPGRTYLVGEKGPELLMTGGMGGHVIANDNIGGGGTVTIHQTYSFQGVAVTQQEFVRGLMAAKADTIRAIRQQGRRQG